MKNISLDKFYKRIRKRILLVSAYLEDPCYNFIIKTCRLKPFSLINSNISRETKLETVWYDEFGSTLNISKGTASIKTNDLRIENKYLIFAGLFDGVPMQEFLKMGRTAFVLVGKEENHKSDHIILSILANDTIRNFAYAYGQWCEVSPLLIGLDALRCLSENLNIKYYKEITELSRPIIPCSEYRAWITKWPPKKLFVSNVGNEIIRNITKEITVDEQS